VCVIGLTALIGSACSVSREATSSQSEQLRVEHSEFRDSSKVEREVVAIRDTVREVTTIHIQTNETGDTLKVVQVTERDRLRDRSAVRDKEEKVIVRTDTVYVEHRDSVFVQAASAPSGARASPVVSAQKWMFWIIVGLIVLTIVFKFVHFF